MSVIATKMQTSGKGQGDHTWHSEPEKNLLISIVLKEPHVLPSDQVIISDIAAESVKELLMSHGIEAWIKPPNDIWVRDKKICGILIEHSLKGNRISWSIIGIGLNVNQTEFAPEISENASSYCLAFGRKCSRAALTAWTWNHFEENYSLFSQTQDFSKLHDAYEAGLVNRGRSVHVLDPRAPFTGTAVGINKLGELLVEPDDGSAVRTIASGEVSVRGVSGYV
jgi:BirA family biotin operon repressor/biotin-[acetyl-CoA-carboxylase] ligase